VVRPSAMNWWHVTRQLRLKKDTRDDYDRQQPQSSLARHRQAASLDAPSQAR
jgi:hypothetical protein